MARIKPAGAAKKILLFTPLTLLLSFLFTCENVPQYCGTGELYDPACAFCYGSQPYLFCGNEKEKYNPLTHGCVPTLDVIGTRCADGTVVRKNTPCGGYTLTVAMTPDGTGYLDPPLQKTNFAAGEPVFLNAVPNSAATHEFAGWAGALTSKENGKQYDSLMNGVNSQLMVVAMFKPKGRGKLEVAAFPKGAGDITVSPYKEIYDSGEKVAVTAAAKPGYVFYGWSGADTSKSDTVRITMDEGKALVAIFTPVVLILRASVEPTDGGAIYINNSAASTAEFREVGVEAAVWARAADGYKFSRWEGKDASFADPGSPGTTVKLETDNAAITAYFTRDAGGTVTPPLPTLKYRLTVETATAGNGNGGSVSLDPAGVEYNAGTTVTATATPNNGYKFAGWSGASTSTDVSVAVTISGNKTLIANFARDSVTPPDTAKYAVTVTGGAGATGGGKYKADTIVVISAGTAPADKQFKNWTSSPAVTFADANNATTTFTMPSSAVTVTAVFEDIPVTTTTYTLTTSVLPSDGGSVSRNPNSASYESGASVTVTATPASGYEFTGWSEASTSTSLSVTITMNGDKALTANFTLSVTPPDSIIYGELNYGGQKYKTVKIGTQTWMAENLNYKPSSGNSWCYNDEDSYCTQYGRLYDWSTAMDVCPVGWHLPSRDEWGILAKYAGGTGTYGKLGTAGTKLKSRTDWTTSSNIPVGTDDYGFSALPGGSYTYGGFADAGDVGFWWTATEFDSDDAYRRNMYYKYEYVYEGWDFKSGGRSVRCLQD